MHYILKKKLNLHIFLKHYQYVETAADDILLLIFTKKYSKQTDNIESM